MWRTLIIILALSGCTSIDPYAPLPVHQGSTCLGIDKEVEEHQEAIGKVMAARSMKEISGLAVTLGVAAGAVNPAAALAIPIANGIRIDTTARSERIAYLSYARIDRCPGYEVKK